MGKPKRQTQVGVSLKLIANSCVATGRLRATLVATPQKGGDTKPPVYLETWPSDVATYLAKLPLNQFRLEPDSGDDAVPPGPALGAPDHDRKFVYLSENDPALTDVTQLWYDAIEKIGAGLWSQLRDDIGNSADGDKQKTRPLAAAYPGDMSKVSGGDFHPNGALQNNGAGVAAGFAVGAVLANPQATYAIEAEAARAQRVYAKLCGGPAKGAQPETHDETPVGASTKDKVYDIERKAAFSDRFKAMVRETDPQRDRTSKIFANVAASRGGGRPSNHLPPTAKIPLIAQPPAPDPDKAKKYAPRAGHIYGGWPQAPRDIGDRTGLFDALIEGRAAADDGELEKVRSVYFTLQGDPLLARLFGFAFDMTFAAPDAEVKSAAFLLSAGSGIWTATAYSKDAQTFWPAPRAYPADSGAPAPELIDGVYEFDEAHYLTSIDVRAAVSDAPDAQDRGGPLRTLGFSFLDAAAADRAARDLAVAHVLQQNRDDGVVLYAEDLVVGRRLDVSHGENGAWRSLMNRYVSYPGIAASVSKRLDKLAVFYAQDEYCGERRYLEETSFQTLARALPVAGAPAGDKQTLVESVVEEAYLAWGGAPMAALACRAEEGATKGPRVMPLARAYDLPGKGGGALRPPPARFSYPYLFSQRAQFLGGGGPSRAEAEKIRKQRPKAFLPNDGANAKPKKFLRHEAIAAPVLLLPATLVSGKRQNEKQVGPMGYEAPSAAMLRSVIAGDRASDYPAPPPGPPDIPAAARASEKSTFRVLVAPQAGLDFCARHSVFDHADKPNELLKGGLGNVRFLIEDVPDLHDKNIKHEHRGFPVATVRRNEGFNADPLIYRREIGGTGAGDGDALGGAVFESLAAPDKNPRRGGGHGYLPDPAARCMSLRLRAADSDVYLDGDLSVPLYDDKYASGFPNPLPVLIEVRKAEGRAGSGCLNSFPRKISGVPPGLVVRDRRWSLAT